MTPRLTSFPFDLWEVVMLDDTAKKARIPSRHMLFCKNLQTMIPFLYLMWDSCGRVRLPVENLVQDLFEVTV